MAEEIQIRPASPEDAADLLEIYRYYVEKTAITFEWETPSLDEFRGRIEKTLERYPYLVAEEEGKILGYAYAGPYYGRKAYDWSVEVTVYLARNARHKGLGRKLYMALEDALHKMHVLNAYACIAYPRTEDETLTRNSADFHARMGYRLIGTFRDCGYKFGRWYDMIWMEKMLGPHPDKPEPVIAWKPENK
ncbi:MAG: GNAT family N-acetyltransferase [Lachnospiraceae bacterium]|nr:GNAT family N-acetyltransferase [Lachnospiraceae bacterium]